MTIDSAEADHDRSGNELSLGDRLYSDFLRGTESGMGKKGACCQPAAVSRVCGYSSVSADIFLNDNMNFGCMK